MSDSTELRDALRVAVPVEPEDKVEARRAALLAVIEREIRSTPRRVEKEQSRLRLRRNGRIVAAAAALVATLGLGMFVAEFEGPSKKASARVGSASSGAFDLASSEANTAHVSLAGQAFETGAGHEKVLTMAGDTKVTLAAQTNVFVQRDTEGQQHLNLASGGLLLSVPPGRKDRSVQVQTAHASIQVTGTVFGVEVGRFSQPLGSAPRTRVSVRRGQVVVVHATGRAVLEPGDTWLSPLILTAADGSIGANSTPDAPAQLVERIGPSAESETAVSKKTSAVRASGARASGPSAPGFSSRGAVSRDDQPVRVAPPSETVSRAAVSRAAVSRAAPSLIPERSEVRPADARQAEEPSSTLAAQNNLLERALAAENRGNRAHAEELIERFLQRYPRSPLRASALAIRKRLAEGD